MTISYAFDDNGGFVARDHQTGNCSYAFPTSSYATLAKRMPYQVAKEMLENENSLSVTGTRRNAHNRHLHDKLVAALRRRHPEAA